MNQRIEILVVDDNRDLLDLLHCQLRESGFKIRIARSGFEALESIKLYGRVDVVLSDFEMPGMTGVELCDSLKTAGNVFPFLLMSGRHDLELADLKKVGVMALLPKPFSTAELVIHILKACGIENETKPITAPIKSNL